MMRGIVIAALSLLLSGPALACQMELESTYAIIPLEDDGLANAERTQCVPGILNAYDPAIGWHPMLDETGNPIIAQDMAGVIAPPGEFIVVILQDNRVAMRWGGPGNGLFFTNDPNHSAFYAYDNEGMHLNGLQIGDVSLDPQTGHLQVGIKTNSAEYCKITSDNALKLDWNWTCMAFPGTSAAISGGAQQELQPLEGALARIAEDEITGKTEAGFIIHGAFARDMFERMNAPLQDDACTGGTMKIDPAGLQCAKDPGGIVQCSFGYNFDDKSLTGGPLTC